MHVDVSIYCMEAGGAFLWGWLPWFSLKWSGFPSLPAVRALNPSP